MEIKTYTAVNYKGVSRTMYSAKVGGTTYHSDSLERLQIYIDNHVEQTQNTF